MNYDILEKISGKKEEAQKKKRKKKKRKLTVVLLAVLGESVCPPAL